MALTEKLTAIADAIRVQSGKTDKLSLAQMPDEIIDLQSLSFEVVGGTSAPSSPSENTIWVNTDTAITGWIFSAAQPESPGAGMVWILTGTSSSIEFNALKKNGIQVYPISARQYVSGAWVDKTAKSYQGGAWADWFYGVLYDNGKKYDNLAFTVTNGTITEYKEYLLFTLTANNATARAFVNKEYDLTEYSKLTVAWQDLSGSTSCGVGIFKNGEQVSDNANQSTNGTITVDISALSGWYQLCIRMYSATSGKTSKITYLALEK